MTSHLVQWIPRLSTWVAREQQAWGLALPSASRRELHSAILPLGSPSESCLDLPSVQRQSRTRITANRPRSALSGKRARRFSSM